MSVERTTGSANAGQNGESGGKIIKRGVESEEAQEFSARLKKMQNDKAEGKEYDKEDMQSLLKYSIQQSIAATGRQIQQNAKDIERENIDKGF